MHAMYFTEQPMAAYDANEGLKYGMTALTFSNKHYNSVEGSRLYNEYIEDYILAEESGAGGGTKSEFTWIIDPLDGTTNFIHGFPVYCVSIALQVKGRIEQAVVYDPTRNDLFTAMMSRRHNDANVLAMGGRIVSPFLADEPAGRLIQLAINHPSGHSPNK